MKYRKKPIVIEAFQMTLYTRWHKDDWPMWLNDAWNMEPSEGAVWVDDSKPNAKGQQSANELFCGTLEGVCSIALGDYIIRGVKGEIYPCKPDIFEATYDPIKEDE